MSVTFSQSYEGQLRKVVGCQKLILPSVRAVIMDDNRQYLFVRRSDNGDWVMPAGALELDESPLDALRREVQEETGLSVESATLISIYSFSGVNSYGNEAHRIAFVFSVDRWSGLLQTQTDETSDARFFSIGELPEVSEMYRETLEDLQAFSDSVIVKEHRLLT